VFGVIIPNARALDRPLTFGDPEQIAAVRAYEAGWVPCSECGMMEDPNDTTSLSVALAVREGLCRCCYEDRLCERCGGYCAADELQDGLCVYCRDDSGWGRATA